MARGALCSLLSLAPRDAHTPCTPHTPHTGHTLRLHTAHTPHTPLTTRPPALPTLSALSTPSPPATRLTQHNKARPMVLHRSRYRDRRPSQPTAPPPGTKREDIERQRLLTQLDRERRRINSLDTDVRQLLRRQEEMRRRARPSLYGTTYLPTSAILVPQVIKPIKAGHGHVVERVKRTEARRQWSGRSERSEHPDGTVSDAPPEFSTSLDTPVNDGTTATADSGTTAMDVDMPGGRAVKHAPTPTPTRSNSRMKDVDLDPYTQLALARCDEAVALRRIERAERLIKIATLEGLLERLERLAGGSDGYEEGSEGSEGGKSV